MRAAVHALDQVLHNASPVVHQILDSLEHLVIIAMIDANFVKVTHVQNAEVTISSIQMEHASLNVTS